MEEIKCKNCGTRWEKGDDKNITYVCPKCFTDEKGWAHLTFDDDVQTGRFIEA